MSGIKGVIKYISQLLILSSFSIIFLPIICLKCYEEKSEISIFKFMQWSIGKSTKSFLGDKSSTAFKQQPALQIPRTFPFICQFNLTLS